MHFSLAQEGTLMTSSQQTDPWQKLAEHCASEVLCAPKTWGDPLRSLVIDMPQHLEGLVSYVLRNIVGYPWCDHLALLAAVLYSQNVQYRTVQISLGALHRASLISSLLSIYSRWQIGTWINTFPCI